MREEGDVENSLENQSEQVVLPITRAGLDELIANVAEKFDLPKDSDFVADGVATAIMHMPPHRGYAPIAHFGNAAIKSLANEAAYGLLSELGKKRKAVADAEKAASQPPKEADPVGQEPVSNS